MRSRLKYDSFHTTKYLETLPTIYYVGFWYRYGVREYRLAGWKEENKVMIPMVYDFDDFNGEGEPAYLLRPITHTTTGTILFWTISKEIAKDIAEALNLKNNYK